MKFPRGGISLHDTLSQYEYDLITMALEVAKGNKTHAATLLDIPRTTLIAKLKRRGIVVPNVRGAPYFGVEQ